MNEWAFSIRQCGEFTYLVVARQPEGGPSTWSTLQALDGAIEKWREIAAYYQRALRFRYVPDFLEDMGVVTCPLCRKFECADCRGCPINEATELGCAGAPYEDYVSRAHLGDTQERFNTATAMWTFLKGLRAKYIQEHPSEVTIAERYPD